MTLDAVRSVADAVLYEGYLLYPYRARNDLISWDETMRRLLDAAEDSP